MARQVLIAMDQHSIILRAANPAFDEGLVFARYLDEIARFYRIMLGRRVVDIIATAYTQPNHNLSYQNTIFVERDGVIVGMVSGYTAGQHRRSSYPPLKQAAGGRALRMMFMARLMARQQRFLGTHADGDFYVQAFAVDRDLRDQCIGSALMDAMEERARANGSKRLSLDVAARNEGARRLYERRGMTVESGWPELPCLPRFILRMTKSL